MVHAMLESLAALGAVTILALLPSAGCAFAEGKSGTAPRTGQTQVSAEQNKAALWYKLCRDVPVQEPAKPGEPKQQKPEEMKRTAVCLTQADIRDDATLIVVAKLAVRQIAGQPRSQLLVALPLDGPPPALLVKLDDKELVKLAFTTCDRAGCYAEANIEPTTVDQMKSGKQLTFSAMGIAGHTWSVPLQLEGFAKAIDGPPLSPEKYIEEQRKIAELIKARLTELRKQEEARQSGQNAPPPAAPAQAPANSGK